MSINKEETLHGIVTKAQAGIYYVHNNGRVIECYLRGRLKRESLAEDGIRHLYTDPVAVGDEVTVTLAEGETGAIEAIAPRKSKISRIASGPAPVEQVIVANADQMIIVLSVKMPSLNTRLLDRFLIVAEAGELEPIICINKMDLVNDSEKRNLYDKTGVYEKLGYRMHYTSAVKGDGLKELVNIMKGKLSALAGPSGTGKSTLINAIQPDLNLRTGQIRAKAHKGKHTTSNVELHPMDFGGYVVDTPGIRELGLWDVWQEELALYFREMQPYIGSCKFYDCSHIIEPECAIKEAVKKGKISKARYESYVKLRRGTSRDENT